MPPNISFTSNELQPRSNRAFFRSIADLPAQIKQCVSRNCMLNLRKSCILVMSKGRRSATLTEYLDLVTD